jgi:hypothetical protein
VAAARNLANQSSEGPGEKRVRLQGHTPLDPPQPSPVPIS